MGRVSDVRWRRVGAVGLGHRARQELARGRHRHGSLPRGPCHGAPVTGYRHRAQAQGIDTGHCRGSTSQWHINKDTPDEKSSGVSEERQLPTLPPGLAVPSAMTGLASLFGMGRGGSPSL